jgi:DNA-binding NtrC family response regulator
MNVLVIDESATLYKIFKIGLSQSQYRVHHAKSLLEASHAQSLADIFIIDADTATKDLALFLETCNATKTLVLKSVHTKADIKSLEKKGYTYFLSKPFDSKDILGALNEMSPDMSPLIAAPEPKASSYTDQSQLMAVDRPILHANPQDQMEAFIVQEAPMIVKEAVRGYCQEHFAKIARSVLTEELRRLAEEKTRSLMES